MSLKEQLYNDMKEAMREKEAGKVRLSAIRMVWAEIKNKEIDRRRDLTPDEILEIVAKEVKLRREALPDYERSGRGDLTAKLYGEIDVLKGYLPEQLSREEINSLIKNAIKEIGATGPRDLGKIMGQVIPKTKGRADGKLVNTLARQLLAEL